MDLFIQYAIGAAAMAMADSGLEDRRRIRRSGRRDHRRGFMRPRYHRNDQRGLTRGGPRKISPFFIPKVISNLAPGHVAIRYGAKGVNWTPTSACASGTHAIGEAFHLIRRGLQDAVIAGGAESTITPLAVGGFAAMKALSTRNDEPVASEPAV